MLLSDLVNTSQRVAATRKRLEKRALLAELINAASETDRRLLLHYLTGAVPQGRVGVGPALVGEIIATDAAESSTLTLEHVDAAVARIAAISGAGSKARRRDELAALFAAATDDEQRLLAGLLLGELRQGALDGVLVEAVAEVTDLPAAAVRRASMLAGDLPSAALAALERGGAGLDEFRLTPMRALQPMLAQPATDLDAALAAIPAPIIDAKLDGARVQIHRRGKLVRVFSRQLNDVTASVPEVVAAIGALPVNELILDGEVIALDTHGRPRPFQQTMRRFGRRRAAADLLERLPLSLFVFDCLLVDGQALIDAPLHERLRRASGIVPAELTVPRLRASCAEDARQFVANVLARGHEGVMIKAPDSVYAAGNRGADWLKVKPVETLDLVIIAAEWGSGRRRGWLSNLHLACRNDDDDGFVMLGKTFKGLTDATLRWQTEQLLARETHRDGHVVHVRPELVAEIAFSDVQASPQYPAGLALRFARVRRYREDKTAGEADVLATVRRLHVRATEGALND
ncbi:MAG: ATP-dependent DNA ligase [Pseudomonadota bacterium]